MQPDVEAADQHFQETLNAAKEDRQSRLPWTMEKGHVAVALSEGLLEDYLASDAKFFEDVLEPLDKWVGLSTNNSRVLTCCHFADRESPSISRRTGGCRSQITTGEISRCRKRHLLKQVRLSGGGVAAR
jgi:hypothetical protein